MSIKIFNNVQPDKLEIVVENVGSTLTDRIRTADCELVGQGVRNSPSSRIRKPLSRSSKLSDLPNLTLSFKMSRSLRQADLAFDGEGVPKGVCRIRGCPSRGMKRSERPIQNVSVNVSETVAPAKSEVVRRGFQNAPTGRIVVCRLGRPKPSVWPNQRVAVKPFKTI